MISAKVSMWGTLIGAITQDDIGSVPRFQYDKEFLKSGIEIAPITMPLGGQVYSFPSLNPTTFFGLPGAFADSLPDKYGSKVLERYLNNQGRSYANITAVERLCYMGKRGMGALEYEPDISLGKDASRDIDIDALVNLASDILLQREELSADSMEQMIKVGTSAGGARAKAIIAINFAANDIKSGQIEAGDGYEYWIIKFDGVANNKDKGDKADGPQYTLIEYAYNLMARDCGINVPDFRIYKENGRNHFMTKRFDRDSSGRKLHMLSLAGMANFDFNTPGANSYEQVSDIIYRLGMGSTEAEQLYRRMVFNEVAKNYDDHVKNISFLMDRKGKWTLAPAYDLTYAYDKSNFWLARHQMTINGKQENITDEDLINAGLRMNLSSHTCSTILKDIKAVVSERKIPGDGVVVSSQALPRGK